MTVNYSRSNQKGFTLVEIMVGLVIGLIATLVIMQIFSAFEGNKRSTTGISDAQTSGSIGLFMIQRELQFAGYGIPLASGTLPVINNGPDLRTYTDYTGMTQADQEAAYAAAYTAALAAYNAQIAADTLTVNAGENFSALRCTNTIMMNLDADNDPATPNVNVDIITPVTITDGAAGGNDTISLQYGTTSRGAIPTRVTTPVGTTYVGVKNNMGCRFDDVVLAVPDINTGNTTCTAAKVTSTNAWLDGPPTAHTNGFNVDANADKMLNTKVACLGKVRQVVFDVNNNELRKDGKSIVTEIVSLQAQYGISNTPNSEVVTQWVDATGATWGVTPLAINDRNRIKAVRVALVARNNLFEKTVVSQACSGAAAGPAKVCVWNGQDVNLGALANWDHYRYRTYETIIPIRNVLAASPEL